MILLTVDRLPSGATAEPVWLWWSHPQASSREVDLLWQAFLRPSQSVDGSFHVGAVLAD